MSGLESPEVEMDTSSTSYSSGSQGNADLDADRDGSSCTSSPSSVDNHDEQRHQRAAGGGYPLHFQSCQEEQMARLYPYVEQDQLPSHWSTKDKPNFISVSEDGLKVHYKGQGKTHKDAAAVRANAPVPQSCLLYYFEVKITSKGRDGYMGIGLAAANVSTNRLPGWDKQSYGYHGDDGHSFNSSGTGTPYGPTFTTGDTIGCGYNLVEGKCFYTKNGLSLGVAFTDLPKVPLYPTVGLQTMGEELVANFGSELFMYDIEQDVIALRKSLTKTINSFPVNHGEWQPMLHSLVQSWLIHNGYCGTAQIFSESAKIPFNEDVQAIKNRLKIQQLVLSGRISEAIAMTNRLYPTVLQNDPNLLFILKCRQFIEFVCCYDRESSNGSTAAAGTSSSSEAKMDVDGESPNGAQRPSEPTTSAAAADNTKAQPAVHIEPVAGPSRPSTSRADTSGKDRREQQQLQMNTKHLELMIAYGKELNSFSKKLNDEYGPDEETRLMLEEAFHFVAFANPLESFLHSKLVYLDRENVCQQLNNALVNACSSSSSSSGDEATSTPTTSAAKKPVAIETVIKHAKELVVMNHHAGAWLFDRV